MPAYQGGKSRLGRRIHDVILIIEDDLLNHGGDNLPYLEPFVGMGGVMYHFAKDADRELYASDKSEDIILMWQALQKGWKPPTKCSEECYNEMKNATPSADRAFIGSVASWGGNWFHNYRLKYAPKGKNYLLDGYRGLMKMKPAMDNVTFDSPKSYEKYDPEGMLIYCDPPYFGNKLGNHKSLFRTFNHSKFWETMRKWSKDNIVIVSESSAPHDFKKIWSTESSIVTTAGKRSKKYQDNLYVHNSIFQKISEDAKKAINRVITKV